MKILIEIDKSEFKRLENCEETYYANGCIFDEEDNLIAFPVYKKSFEDIETYYKVLNNE